MKKAFIITSAIEVSNDYPLTYSNVRSHFNSVDRFNQTIFTIANLDAVASTDSTFFIIDASDNPDSYRGVVSYQKNLVFISIKEEFPDIHRLVKEHPNKSYCESLILATFMSRYKNELSEYDYFFKMSGRYFTDSSFDVTIFNDSNLDKLFFKAPLKFSWNEHWSFEMVDRRKIQGDNNLYQYCSVLYGWGKNHYGNMLDIYRVICEITSHPTGMKYDVETLLYFFCRKFEQSIVPVDWKVYGWDGTSGTFLRY